MSIDLYTRKNQVLTYVDPETADFSRQLSLLSNPELVSDKELLSLQSNLRKRSLIYYAWFAGIPAAGIVLLRAKGLFALSLFYIGHKLGSCYSNVSLISQTNIPISAAASSKSTHYDDIAHFNYLEVVPLDQEVEFLAAHDKHDRIERSRYI